MTKDMQLRRVVREYMRDGWVKWVNSRGERWFCFRITGKKLGPPQAVVIAKSQVGLAYS
jgi:hypothetical protein